MPKILYIKAPKTSHFILLKMSNRKKTMFTEIVAQEVKQLHKLDRHKNRHTQKTNKYTPKLIVKTQKEKVSATRRRNRISY